MAFRIPSYGLRVTFESPTGGTAQESVSFTDTTNQADKWSWDFGDGSGSTAQNPTKTYSSAGIYDVSLLASRDDLIAGVFKTSIDIAALPFVTSGLIFYVNAGSTSSYPGTGTEWYDISGQNRTVDLIGGPTFSTDGGGSIVFDGVNDRAATTDFSINLTEKTMLAWVRVTNYNVSGNGDGVIGSGKDGSTSFDAITYNETNQGWGFGSEGFARTSWSNVKEISDDWVMITAVYQSGTDGYKMYRNDELILTATHDVLDLNVSDVLFYFGWRSLFGGTYYGYLDGKIGIGMIYDRALSSAEVETNFNVFKGNYGY